MQEVNADKVYVVYGPDSKGEYHEQPLSDIVQSGTLIDPMTGDDLEVSHAVVVS